MSEELVSVFETRLRAFVFGILELGALDMTPQWHRDLAKETAEDWTTLLSGLVQRDVKLLLGQEKPPAFSEFYSLLDVDTRDQGVYFGLLTPGNADACHSDWGYVGSGTRTDGGIASRTSEHLNPNYMRTANKFFYRLIDDVKVKRELTFRRLATYHLTDGEESTVLRMRIACILLEAIMVSWLGCAAPEKWSIPIFAAIIALSPWARSDFAWKGANHTCPLAMDIPRPQGMSSLTPEESRARMTAQSRAARHSWPKERKQYYNQHVATYTARVTNPVKKMRAEGATEEEIIVFRENARREYAKGQRERGAAYPFLKHMNHVQRFTTSTDAPLSQGHSLPPEHALPAPQISPSGAQDPPPRRRTSSPAPKRRKTAPSDDGLSTDADCLFSDWYDKMYDQLLRLYHQEQAARGVFRRELEERRSRE